jgi:cytochrome P450
MKSVEHAVSTDISCPARLVTTSFMRDPYPALTALREAGPAAVVENNGFRMWVLTRYADVRRLLADSSFLKDVVGRRKQIVGQCMVRPERRARLPHESRRGVLDRDGEDHRRLRAVLGGFFTPARLAGYRPGIERIATELLDRLPLGEPVDLIARYARPLSATFIADLLGIPEDERDGFPRWENDVLTAPAIERIEEAGRQLYALALRLIELKRREPADDVLTKLLQQHDEDSALSDEELASTYIVLMVGGSEPTSAIGSGLLLLLTHPEQADLVRADPSRYGACVEEILRYESPFRMLPPRFADQPLELGGTTIPAGELILPSVAAANRDPSRFDDPDRFDITRRTKGHLSFGHGAHRCLGAELGRATTETALRLFFDRFPRSRLAIPASEVEWRLGTFMRRLDTLPVVLG